MQQNETAGLHLAFKDLPLPLIICKKNQTPKLSDFLTAPLPTPGYQQMCYLTKTNLNFQLFPVSVGEHYHCPFCSAGIAFPWVLSQAQVFLQFLILESFLYVACFSVFIFSYKFSSLPVKIFMHALNAASSSPFAQSRAALPTCVSPIRAAQLIFPDCCSVTVSFLSLYLSHGSNILDKTACCQLKDFHGLRSSQLFSFSFNSDTSLHCPLVKMSNSCIHIFSHAAYHALVLTALTQNFLHFLSQFSSFCLHYK